jgi:hypothetical protein
MVITEAWARLWHAAKVISDDEEAVVPNMDPYLAVAD